MIQLVLGATNSMMLIFAMTDISLRVANELGMSPVCYNKANITYNEHVCKNWMVNLYSWSLATPVRLSKSYLQ